MPPRDLERRRPRPVADTPAADPAAVAKSWLLELLRGATLDEAARVPTDRLAADGPPLCALLLDALRSDAALEDLAALAERAAALTGAVDATGVVRACEALRSACWSVLHRDLDDDLAAPVADRLAHLCALVLEAALRGAARGAARTLAPDDAPADGPRSGPLAAEAAATATAPPAAAAAPADADADADADAPPSSRDGLTRHVRAEPSLDDLGQQAAPFEQAIERRLSAYARDGRPFTVLLIEVDDADRLLATGAEDALARAEDAIGAVLRPGDLLTRETPGRLWVTAPDTAGLAAKDLAGRLAGAVPGAAALHGTALRAAVGVATCPDDGRTAEQLVEQADERLFAARAAGVPVL